MTNPEFRNNQAAEQSDIIQVQGRDYAPGCLLETSRHTTGPIVRLPEEDRMSAAAYRVLQYGPFFQFGVWIQAVVFLVGFFTINYIIHCIY